MTCKKQDRRLYPSRLALAQHSLPVSHNGHVCVVHIDPLLPTSMPLQDESMVVATIKADHGLQLETWRWGVRIQVL